jgi:tRNA-specific 2-thiouridylase
MRVFVGMSGGVDSSVAAALMKEAGHDVTGVFLKVWQPDFVPCTAAEDRLDALRVAAHLSIPFRTYDLEEEYKRYVVDYMLREYQTGRTPNPDIMCNTFVKFGAFLERALAEGADMIATGHYAIREGQRDRGTEGQNSYILRVSRDAEKDQTYFLSMISQQQLSRSLFPVGGYCKDEVRALARRFGLPTAEKKDSQGLCFLGAVDMKEFLSRFIPRESGPVEDETGAVIGAHDGHWFYTIGQRHGFSVSAPHASRAPLYVVGKDAARNALIVAPHEPHERGTRIVELENVNWIAGSSPEAGARLKGRFRYRQPFLDMTLKEAQGDRAVVELAQVKAVPSGQILALYEDDACLGGGIIT